VKDTELILAEIQEVQRQMRLFHRIADRRISRMENRIEGLTIKRMEAVEKDVKAIAKTQWSLVGVFSAITWLLKRSSI